MALSFENVAKAVGQETHIHPTSLTLERGSMNVLLGPTLAGKTTLMRLMAGLDRPTQGRVLWDGADVTGVSVRDRDVAMVYQQFINYPGMTVYENIASPLRLQRTPAAEIDRQVRAAADMMKLNEAQLGRKPLELSGGQQQRCALARALVKNAGLVLLDEPLANLDYKLREEFREEIPRIFAESGAIFVYATTEPLEALLLGGAVACMWEGRVTQFGATADVYRSPADAVTARVFSDPPMNFIHVEKAGGAIDFGEGQSIAASGGTAALADGRYLAGFRPNHLFIDAAAAPPGALSFEAEVKVAEITGSESYVHFAYGKDDWVALAEGVHDPTPGEQRRVFVDARRIFIFDGEGKAVASDGAG